MRSKFPSGKQAVPLAMRPCMLSLFLIQCLSDLCTFQQEDGGANGHIDDALKDEVTLEV